MIDIDSMPPGADMDRLVEAEIGVAPQYPLPLYSADWSAAMDAAGRCGLFTRNLRGMAQILGHDGGQWTVNDCDEPPDPAWGTAKAPTGPHAICRAILKLSEGKQ